MRVPRGQRSQRIQVAARRSGASNGSGLARSRRLAVFPTAKRSDGSTCGKPLVLSDAAWLAGSGARDLEAAQARQASAGRRSWQGVSMPACHRPVLPRSGGPARQPSGHAGMRAAADRRPLPCPAACPVRSGTYEPSAAGSACECPPGRRRASSALPEPRSSRPSATGRPIAATWPARMPHSGCAGGLPAHVPGRSVSLHRCRVGSPPAAFNPPSSGSRCRRRRRC